MSAPVMRFSPTELEAVRVPDIHSRVHKDECAYSFDTPESPGGLHVCMTDWLAFGKEHVDLHWEKTGHTLYLHIKSIPKPQAEVIKEEPKQEPTTKPTVLGIGVEGGFAAGEEKKHEVETHLALVRLPTGTTLPLPAEVPDKIQSAIDGIIAAESAEHKDKVQSWVANDQVVPSKFSENLVQLNNGAQVPTSGWKCQHMGCPFTSNLWLNLTDGVILCGRGNSAGMGNEHAVAHFNETGFPLVVKLGTLTATAAEVYSYPEDNMVIDTQLEKHLAHFGIDRKTFSKTESTLAELELDQNQWNRIQEADKPLVPLYGPGYTGLTNLGNSCYMASVLQCIFVIPAFQHRYSLIADKIWKETGNDPSNDFPSQMAKLGRGLLSGKYSIPSSQGKSAIPPSPGAQSGIPPRTMKAIIGKENAEFASSRQQDALEFLQLLLSIVERTDRAKKLGDPSKVMQFQVEERLQCSQSKTVRYTYRNENAFPLPIPLGDALNFKQYLESEERINKWKAEKDLYEKQKKLCQALNAAVVSDASLPSQAAAVPQIALPQCPAAVRADIPFQAVLRQVLAPETIEGFFSPAINARTTALKTVRFASFPEILVFQLRRFLFDEKTFQPKKLDVLVDMPMELDLEELRGLGLQANESPMPDASASPCDFSVIILYLLAAAHGSTSTKAVDPMILASLESMGVPHNRAEKAALACNTVDQAMDWLFSHDQDSGIDEPVKATPATNSAPGVSAEDISMLSSMGFTEAQAKFALSQTGNNVERAADWLFSRTDVLDTLMAEFESSHGNNAAPMAPPASAVRPQTKRNNDPAKYQLFAFISHMGTSTQSGHYVAHIMKEGRWVLFNDNKVAISEEPPIRMGYLYFYRRMDVVVK